MSRTQFFIKPMSYGVPQRVEALAKATKLGCGLDMELHSAHTEFYANPDVPIGMIDVYSLPGYKQYPLKYVTTLDSPEDHFDPWADRVESASAPVVGGSDE